MDYGGDYLPDSGAVEDAYDYSGEEVIEDDMEGTWMQRLYLPTHPMSAIAFDLEEERFWLGSTGVGPSYRGVPPGEPAICSGNFVVVMIGMVHKKPGLSTALFAEAVEMPCLLDDWWRGDC